MGLAVAARREAPPSDWLRTREAPPRTPRATTRHRTQSPPQAPLVSREDQAKVTTRSNQVAV